MDPTNRMIGLAIRASEKVMCELGEVCAGFGSGFNAKPAKDAKIAKGFYCAVRINLWHGNRPKAQKSIFAIFATFASLAGFALNRINQAATDGDDIVPLWIPRIASSVSLSRCIGSLAPACWSPSTKNASAGSLRMTAWPSGARCLSPSSMKTCASNARIAPTSSSSSLSSSS
jgi:hypothetical protein